MFLGLDVGGTHTDAVLLDKKGVVSYYKAVTNHKDLLSSITSAINEVTQDCDKKNIKRINLSTTLSTNAIVEKRIEDVAVIISSGPGIDPGNFKTGDNYYTIDGSIDHRGTVIKDLDPGQLAGTAADAEKKGISLYAAVTKFSTRNPAQENKISDAVSKNSDFITMGHRLSGQLSFPRRIHTAYLNSAVWRIYNDFADAIEASIKDIGIEAEINILKADGGTMPFESSRDIPVESILSGPAASIMGIISLASIKDDAVILDIGGTTTDIAVFAKGAPLIEKEGISLNSLPTLVRALSNRSIGVGGDSLIKVSNGAVAVGPEREGPAMADGGVQPTLVDALNYAGRSSFGSCEDSAQGIEELAGKNKIDPRKLADRAIEYAVKKIKSETESMIEDIFDRPVYTIHEMFEGERIKPEKIYCVGGPAEAFSGIIEKEFALPVTVPENFSVANAIGSAVARTTIDIELFADTGKGRLLVPNLDIEEKIQSTYTLGDAERDAREFLKDHLFRKGVTVDKDDIEIVESSSFKMVQGFFSRGRDIRVKCQIKPGVLIDLAQ